jgi:nucleoside 2-deoxyribosyltransferase
MRILISHDWATDGPFALTLTTALGRIGAEPRIENLKGTCGEQNFECLKRELRKRYDHVIPVLSEAYSKNQFLIDEFFAAVSLDESSNGFVLPAMIGEHNIPLPRVLRQRAIDFRLAKSFDEAFQQLTAGLSGSRQAFVVMRFGDPQLDKAYDEAIAPAIVQAGFSPLRIDERKNPEMIITRVLREIDRSEVVIVDLTGERPNCYMELGYALAKEKELILAIRGDEDLSFDIGARQIIRWHDREQLRAELILWLSNISERLAIRPRIDQTIPAESATYVRRGH